MPVAHLGIELYRKIDGDGPPLLLVHGGRTGEA
jgi:hypothetical protein